MILTCPACSKRYVLDAARLGGGRKVRCASCGHMWHQKPAGDTQPPRPAMPPPRRAEPPASLSAPALPDEWSLQADFGDDFESAASAAVEDRGIPLGSGVPMLAEDAEAARRRRRRLEWTGLVAAVLVLSLGVVWARKPLVAMWPPMAALYEAIGMGIELPGSGLELREVSTQARDVEGNPMLFISGQIANPSKSQRQVPEIVAQALGPDKQVLTTWTIKPSSGRLFPGQVATFQSAVPDEGKKATEMHITFAGAGK